MSEAENTNTGEEVTTAVGTATPTDEDAELNAAVEFIDGMAAATRDKKNSTLVWLTATEDERASIRAFVHRIQVQQGAARKIYALSVAAAQKRTGGKAPRAKGKTPAADASKK